MAYFYPVMLDGAPGLFLMLMTDERVSSITVCCSGFAVGIQYLWSFPATPNSFTSSLLDVIIWSYRWRHDAGPGSVNTWRQRDLGEFVIKQPLESQL